MKTKRLSLPHSGDVFLKARDLYAAQPALRKEWISVRNAEGSHLYYLKWIKNEDIPYIADSIQSDDLWDYDLDHIDLDLSLLERAQVFLFEALEEYTLAIARILRKYLPDRFLFFLDKNASFFFDEGDCVHIVDSLSDFYNRFSYFSKKNLMYITSTPRVTLEASLPRALEKGYNSIQVMGGLFWKTRKLSLGELHPDKTFYLIRNPISFEGFVDVVRYTLFRVSFLKKKRGNILPVVDLGEWGDGNQFTKEGENIWTMFFKQMTDIPLEEVYQSKNVILSDMSQFALNPFLLEEIAFADWKVLMKDAFRFRPEVQKQLEEKQQALFQPAKGKRVLGVVGRGSDYTSSQVDGVVRKPVGPEEFLKRTEGMVKEKHFDYVFLATEEKRILELFEKSSLGDRLLSVPQKRVDYEDERYKDKLLSEIYSEMERDGYRDTLDYLLVLYCLSRCDALVATTNCGAFSFPVGLNGGKYEFAFYY